MYKNTGKKFEDKVYKIISDLVNSNEFLISHPNVKVCRNAQYYSKDRDGYIECEISVEKYIDNPYENNDLKPSIIVIIECKDYAGSVPVNDVEEFHAKLQQIGADNTKGIMITSNGCFQTGTLKYANSKGIALARILPDNQVKYFMSYMTISSIKDEFSSKDIAKNIIYALTDRNYISENKGNFFSLTFENSLQELIKKRLK